MPSFETLEMSQNEVMAGQARHKISNVSAAIREMSALSPRRNCFIPLGKSPARPVITRVNKVRLWQTTSNLNLCRIWVFDPKTDEMTGDCRKLHNEELHNLYSSPNIIRIIKSWRKRWAGHVARMGEKRNAYRISVGKPEGKRPLGRPRRNVGGQY
jgi:hypothetical protein